MTTGKAAKKGSTVVVVREAHGHEVLGGAVVVHLVTPENNEMLFTNQTESTVSQLKQVSQARKHHILQLKERASVRVVQQSIYSLKQHNGKGLHQSVEGGLTNTFRMATLWTDKHEGGKTHMKFLKNDREIVQIHFS